MLAPAKTASLTFDRIELGKEWRCNVCDYNQVVFLHNAELLLCAVCAGARLAERILPVTILEPKDAAAWLERHPNGHHGERSVLMGQAFFSRGMRILKAKEDLENIRLGEFFDLEIWQETAWRK